PLRLRVVGADAGVEGVDRPLLPLEPPHVEPPPPRGEATRPVSPPPPPDDPPDDDPPAAPGLRGRWSASTTPVEARATMIAVAAVLRICLFMGSLQMSSPGTIANELPWGDTGSGAKYPGAFRLRRSERP